MASCVLTLGALVVALIGRPPSVVASEDPVPVHDEFVVRLGGSLAFSGEFRAVSKASWQGIQLLAETVNVSKAFKLPGGHLKLELVLEDDAGDQRRAEEIYRRLAARGKADFFLGPHAPSLAAVAAQVGNESGILTMLFGAASPSLFELGYRTLFTVDVSAANYMAHALEVVRQMGATSIALVWEANDFDRAVCGGAVEHAQLLGLGVLAEVQLDAEGITSQVRLLKMRGADVLIGCGQFRAAVQLVVSARALSFNPKAMVLSIGSATAFVHSVGASNANYIMSPVSWVPYLNLSCPVFASTQGFVDAYYRRWQEAPTYQSAAAAASGIALLASIQAAGTMELEAVRRAMLALEVETFYAHLSFHRNGTRRGAAMLTEQVQPLGQDRSPVERYMESKVVSVGPFSPPMWPMPSWDQKEIDVYPCPAGEAWEPRTNTTGQEIMTCVKCPAGRYRHPRSVFCEECEAGQYGAQEGMSQCEVCPIGASCPEGFRPGRPNATRGYYKMPLGQLKMLECAPQELCLGGNTCSGQNTGILCAQCKEGFARAGFGAARTTCSACRNSGWSLFAIGMTASIYTLYIWIIVKATLSATTSIRAIHSVILKICVNYLQFAGTAFEATEFRDMVVSICGSKARYLVPFILLPEFIQYPFGGTMSFDCLLGSYGIRWYEACIMLGLFLMPLAFLLKTLFAFVRLDFLRKRCSQQRRRRRLPEPQSTVQQHSEPQEQDVHGSPLGSERVTVELEACGSPFSKATSTPHRRTGSGTSGQRPAGGTPVSHTAASTSGLIQEGQSSGLGFLPSFSLRTLSQRSPASRRDMSGLLQLPCSRPSTRSFTIGAPSPLHRTTEMMSAVANSSILARFVNSSVVMSFVLHPVVVRLLVVGFECVDLDVLRQKYDFDVTCKSDEHTQWLIWSIVGLLVFGFGTPLALLLMLWRHRGQLLQEDVCKRFGFLYNGFEQRYWFVEPFFMWRKVVLLLFFTFPTMYLRTVGLLFISWVFIFMHMRFQPFDNRSYLCLDRLEAMSLRALTVTVMARLVFDIRKELSNHFFDELVKHWSVDALLVVTPLAFHLYFWTFAVWSLLRNTVVKHLSLKADMWGLQQLTRPQRFLLWLDKHRNKASWSIQEAQGAAAHSGVLCIDTRQLSQREQDYLFVALRDTLHRFMDSKQELHLGLLADTVCEALRRCRLLRRCKALHIERLHRREAEEPSCWRRLLRWRGELRLSLHPGHGSLQPQRRPSQALRDFDLEEEEAELLGLGTCGACRLCCPGLAAHLFNASCSSPSPSPSPTASGQDQRDQGKKRRPRRSTNQLCSNRSPAGPVGVDRKLAMETSQEFTVEELYDALMPLWQGVDERELCAAGVSAEEVRTRALLGHSRSVCELLQGRSEEKETKKSAGRERETEKATGPGHEADPEQVSYSSSDSQCDEATGDSWRSGKKKFTPRLGSFNKVEELLGRSPGAGLSEVVGGEESDESVIEQASQRCHVELPTLLRQHDRLLTENLQLRSENETLRRRVTTAAWAPSIVTKAKKAAAQALASSDSGTPVPRRAGAEAALDGCASELQGQAQVARPPVTGVPTPSANTLERARAEGAERESEVAEGQGGVGARAAAPRTAVTAVAVGPVVPVARDTGRDSSIAIAAGAGGEGGIAARRLEEAEVEGPEAPEAAAAHAAALGRAAAPAAAGISLPGVEKRRLEPESPPSTLSGSSFGPEPPTAPGGSLPCAWSGAMRPINPGAWPRLRPFEFMRAARPTSPGTWPS